MRGGAHLSRKQLDELQEFVKRYGAGALAWIKLGDELSSSLLKALGEESVTRLAATAGAEKGDAVLIVAGKADGRGRHPRRSAQRGRAAREADQAEHVRAAVGDGVPDVRVPRGGRPLLRDAPPVHVAGGRRPAAFERGVEGGETHLLGGVRAKAYDAVVNGIEVAGGSIRIHRRDVQRLVFKALGLTEEKARERFGFFLDALEYGTPPHGGIAAGIERTLMALTGIDNIRDLMAFPKTASAADLMIDAPGPIDPHQLEELHIEIDVE